MSKKLAELNEQLELNRPREMIHNELDNLLHIKVDIAKAEDPRIANIRWRTIVFGLYHNIRDYKHPKRETLCIPRRRSKSRPCDILTMAKVYFNDLVNGTISKTCDTVDGRIEQSKRVLLLAVEWNGMHDHMFEPTKVADYTKKWQGDENDLGGSCRKKKKEQSLHKEISLSRQEDPRGPDVSYSINPTRAAVLRRLRYLHKHNEESTWSDWCDAVR